MKKQFFLLIAVLGLTWAAAAGGFPPPLKIRLDKSFSQLVVEDHITVVLTREAGSEISIHGERAQALHLRASIRNNKLYLWMARGQRGEDVIVYVPAALLERVTLNGDSQLSSSGTLFNPSLAVCVNGASILNLRSTGKIQVEGSSEYEYRVVSE